MSPVFESLPLQVFNSTDARKSQLRQLNLKVIARRCSAITGLIPGFRVCSVKTLFGSVLGVPQMLKIASLEVANDINSVSLFLKAIQQHFRKPGSQRKKKAAIILPPTQH